MRKTLWISAAALLCATALPTVAQQTSQQTSAAQSKSDPLVEAARKARADNKTAPKAARVFTNDNLPSAGNAISVIGKAAPPPDDKDAPQNDKDAASNGKPNAKAGTSAATDEAKEAEWHKRFAAARRKLHDDEMALSVMQRELGQLQVQYYPDPTKALMQSVTREDLTKKQEAIDKKKSDIEADKQAISDLQDELRKSGNPVSWGEEQ